MTQHPHQRQTRKKGAQHREAPQARRGLRNLTTYGHEPNDHNGGSPHRVGQRPEQLYTGPVQKRALYTCGPEGRKDGATLPKQRPCTETCAAHMKAKRPKRGGQTSYTRAQKKARSRKGVRRRRKPATRPCKSGRTATQPTLPRRKP